MSSAGRSQPIGELQLIVMAQLGDLSGLAVLHFDAEEVARRKSVDVEIAIAAERDAVKAGGALRRLLEVGTFQPDF